MSSGKGLRNSKIITFARVVDSNTLNQSRTVTMRMRMRTMRNMTVKMKMRTVMKIGMR